MINSKSFTLGLTLLFFITSLNAQVGIGTTDPQGALDITSTTDGLLIPRVALVNLATVTVVTPTESELVYNTATVNDVTPGYYYLSTATGPWVRIGGANEANSWLTIGNAGLNASTNFIGTTDGVDVVFRRNNVAAGRIGLNNTSFGVGALANIIPTESASGRNNVAFGTNALGSSVNGVENVAIGSNALSGSTSVAPNQDVGYANIAIGYNTLTGIRPGNDNIAIGWEAAKNNNSSKLIAIGYRAGINNRSLDNIAIGELTLANLSNNASRNNTAIGSLALSRNTSATVSQNVAIGYHAGRGLGSSNNVVIGSEALIGDTSAESVVAIGEKAMNQSTNSFNVAVGREALFNSTGTHNVAIGYRAARIGAGSNNIVIGSDATVSGNDNIVIGRLVSSPAGNNRLSIGNLIYGEFDNNILRTNGQLQIGNPAGTGYAFPTTDGTAGQYLQTNGNGAVSWANQSDAKSVMRANITNNQGLDTLGWQKILFNTVLFDTNSEFITATNRFVASSAGYYQINAGFHTNSLPFNDEFYSIAVYVNGNLYQETSSNQNVRGQVSRNINCIVNLNVNDFVEIFVQNFQEFEFDIVEIDSFSGKTFFEVQQIR